MCRAAYPTDLFDAEYTFLEPHLPLNASRGRPRLRPLREILDAIFYVVRTGCRWRLLPREFPPTQTIYDYFRRWRLDGTWERLNRCLGISSTGSRSLVQQLEGYLRPWYTEWHSPKWRNW